VLLLLEVVLLLLLLLLLLLKLALRNFIPGFALSPPSALLGSIFVLFPIRWDELPSRVHELPSRIAVHLLLGVRGLRTLQGQSNTLVLIF
jgi:hypothetical protein